MYLPTAVFRYIPRGALPLSTAVDSPLQSCPLKRAPCTPPKPCGDDDDDSDDDLGIGTVLKFIVIIVTYRHPAVRQRRIRLPALLRLLVYST